MTDARPILVLPGIGNSGPDHWQTRWERRHPNVRRVQQDDWDRPRRDAWVARLEAAVRTSGPDTVLVAHSLGCLLLAHWAASTVLPVRAAMLVAVPDPQGPAFPPEATGFHPLPLRRLPFRSLVVASRDDPYGGLPQAQRCAAAWGSRLVDAGALGHINAASGLGDWPQGLAWLEELLQPA
jgi:predicted alpha/beta hydrolase family esterase